MSIASFLTQIKNDLNGGGALFGTGCVGSAVVNINPMDEISAVIYGIRSGLEFLFARRRASSATEATQDEQLFI